MYEKSDLLSRHESLMNPLPSPRPLLQLQNGVKISFLKTAEQIKETHNLEGKNHHLVPFLSPGTNEVAIACGIHSSIETRGEFHLRRIPSREILPTLSTSCREISRSRMFSPLFVPLSLSQKLFFDSHSILDRHSLFCFTKDSKL